MSLDHPSPASAATRWRHTPAPFYEGVMTAGFPAHGTIRRSDFGIEIEALRPDGHA